MAFIDQFGVCEFTDCHLEDNSAFQGGVSNMLPAAKIVFVRCVFKRNTATSFGGALYLHMDSSSHVEILYCTFEG